MPMNSNRVRLSLAGLVVLALAGLLIAYTDATWEELKPLVDRAEGLIVALIGADSWKRLGDPRGAESA